jgi:ATP-binding cassette, subfamily B, bacterial
MRPGDKALIAGRWRPGEDCGVMMRAVGRLTATGARLRDEAVRPRVMVASDIGRAGWGLVSAMLTVNLLLGLLPVAFILATSTVIGLVPSVVGAGPGSRALGTLQVSFLVAAVLFVIQQALVPVQAALGELARRRIDGQIYDRIIRRSLSGAGIGPMEDQDALTALKEVTRRLEGHWETPGLACVGLLALVARYTRLAALAALVGVVASWPAAVALLLATLMFRYGNRGGLRKYSQMFRTVAGVHRRGAYLREVALSAGPAKELRLFGLTPWLADRYRSEHKAWLAPVWRARRRIYLFPYLGYTAIGLAVATLTFVLLARAGAAHAISLTRLAIGLQATVAAIQLGSYYPESDQVTQRGMLIMTALGQFEASVASFRVREPEPAAPADPAAIGQPSLHFENIAFRYPGAGDDVISGLSLELPARQCTALVGVNGAGKTTIVKLLTRLHEPTAGNIRFGGTGIREFGVEAWRRQVSVVFQDFVRYELSIGDNIAFGAIHAPRDNERIRRAADAAGLAEVINRMPDGLDTPLSRAYAGGTDLSGGQWQRIAIARSLYALDAGARVLVLDEPTASLDVRAEAEFFDQFVALTQNVTSLLISHRFSTVRTADKIAVVAGGRVTEQGSHSALLDAGGRYAGLFHLQAERFGRQPQ